MLLLKYCITAFRFVDATLDRLGTWKAPEMKVLVLRCILEMLQLDSDKTQLNQVCLLFYKDLALCV